jgi:hypothetical protein
MPKKNVSGNKTDRYINLILEISNTHGWQINEVKLKKILGDPSKSQFYNYLQDLTGDCADRPSVLVRIQTEEGFCYKLNERTWENFFLAKDEGEFLLECHKKLGYLIENGLHDLDLINTRSNRKNLSRKFIYLSAIQGKSFSAQLKDHLHTITKSLLGDKRIELKYNEKDYSVYPMSFCQYRDELYLIGYKNDIKEQNLRVFKIARITQVNLTKDKFHYPAQNRWNPAELFKEASGLIIGQKNNAIINVYGNAKKILKEKNFFTSHLQGEFKEYDQYECIYTSESEFLGQLFVYADEIEVLSPKSLKDSFLKKAESAIKVNKQHILKKSA